MAVLTALAIHYGVMSDDHDACGTAPPPLTTLPAVAQFYIVLVVSVGASLFLLRPPHVGDHAGILLILLGISLFLAVFKVRLPLPNGTATMTLNYAPDLACLMIVGPREAMALAALSVWCQCTFRTRAPSPLYRTLFSVGAIAITVHIVGLVFERLGGAAGHRDVYRIVVPALAATTTYFAVNTSFVALAIALSTRVSVAKVWHDNFLWSAPGYFLAAGVAIPAAIAYQHGTYWAVPLTAAPLYLTYRSYRVYLGRVEDEQRHANELSVEKAQLAVEKERLAVTVRSICDGVITTDVEGRIVLMNEAAESIMGVSQLDVTSAALADVLASVRLDPVPDTAPTIRDVLQHGGDRRLTDQSTLTRADGTSCTVECGGTAIRDHDGHVAGSVWVLRDVTDTIRLEQERAKAARLEALGLLAGGLAHDFNNILTAVAGNISLARCGGSLDAETALRLEEAERACLRAKGITNQLLTFSKGGAPVKKTSSIASIVEECTTFTLRGSTVAARFTTSSDVWSADVDVGQISQVIENLVLNAQQAMPDGGIIDVNVHNLVVDTPAHDLDIPAGRYVTIAILDRGVGIPPAQLPQIFDPYFSTKRKGHGLGLATCYSIVRRHGGMIKVESSVGVGSRFSIHLPASDRAAEPRAAPTPTAAPLKGGRVLIMDDEAAIRELASRMFTRLGYEAVVSRDGLDAIKAYSDAHAQNRPFDLVVADLTVPGGMGGREMVPLLKKIDADVRVLVSGGYADDPVMANCAAYGCCATLPKPFALGDIRQTMQQLGL